MSSWHLCFGVHVPPIKPPVGDTLEEQLYNAMCEPLKCPAWIRPLDQADADPREWLMLHCTLPYEHEGPHAVQWQDGEIL